VPATVRTCSGRIVWCSLSQRLVHGGTGKIVSLPTTEDASKLAAAVSNSRAPNQGAIRWSFESLSRSSRVMLTLPERRAESDL
jgi:hypothetical protein